MSARDKQQKKQDGASVSRDMTIRNQYGMHARPAALLVKTAAQYQSEITIEHKGVEVSAKSIMGLLTIEGHSGAVVKMSAQGPDAEDALNAIEELFENNFFED